MKFQTEQWRKNTSTVFLIFFSSLLLAQTQSFSDSNINLSIWEAEKLRFDNPDSSIRMLELLYANAEKASDTTRSINVLMRLARVYGHQAKYKESYDRLWLALLLADAAQMEMAQSNIYRAIGRYYSFYNRKERAAQFLNRALDIKKKLVAKKEVGPARLVQNYLAFVSSYRELNEPELGRAYLDSSFLFHSPTTSLVNISSLKFEQAVLLNREGKFDEALEIFTSIVPWYQENSPSYQVLLYYYMGDAFMGLKSYSQSERYYKMALETSEVYHSHLDFTPLIHESLSNLYYSKGDYQLAHESLNRAKELDAIIFDSRSSNNRPLLEIQDAFRKEKEEQEIFLRDQQIAQFEQEEKVLFLFFDKVNF